MRKYVKPVVDVLSFENADSILTASSVKINGTYNVRKSTITYNQLDLK
jgi:hypothetical protein